MADISLHKKALIIIEHIAKMWGGGEVPADEAFSIFMIAHSALGECNQKDDHSDWVEKINATFEDLVNMGMYDPRQKKAGLN